MSDEHRPEIPAAIEQVVAGLAELGTVLGTAGSAVAPVVGEELRHAMAARDGGDPARAFEHIARAMALLAQAAEKLDPGEAALMRAVLERFRSAVQRWDEAGAKQLAHTMFERSGAAWKKS